MDPKEFSWTEDQQVTVTNPTTETYKFKVHNKEYELGAGQTAKMPGYIAWVYVYGLSTQIAQAENVFNRWNEEDFRQSFYERLVVGTDNLIQKVVVESEPEVTVLGDDEEEGEEESTQPDKTVKPMSAKASNVRSNRA